MDDWVLLAPTRWKLREAIRVTNECLAELRVEQHPDKTFIGRIGRGFDFLGYQFGESGLTGLSNRSLGRLAGNVARRIAAGAGKRELTAYLRRWRGWATGGLAVVMRWASRSMTRPFISCRFAFEANRESAHPA